MTEPRPADDQDRCLLTDFNPMAATLILRHAQVCATT